MHHSSAHGFSRISDKMAFLFDLTPQSRVMVTGRYGGRHAEDFRECFLHCDFADRIQGMPMDLQQGGNGCDLVIFDTRDESSDLDLPRTIGTLRRTLNPEGQLVIIGKNQRSLKRLARMASSGMHRTAAAYTLSPPRTKRILRAGGFQRVLGFLPFPDVENMEECISDEGCTYELPSHYHPTLHLLNALGAYKYVHDDYILFASASEWGGPRRFLSWLGECLVENSKGRDCLRLRGFYPRRRGVLILFIHGIGCGKPVVVRVASSDVVQMKLRKSMYWTWRVRSAVSLPENVKARIPKTVAMLRYKDSAVHVEEMLDGRVAWKLVRDPSIKKSVDVQAWHFLEDIRRASLREVYVSDSIFRGMIEEDVDRVGDTLERWSRLKSHVDEVTDVLRREILGRRIPCVWGHGDFGYGNILVDRASGTITGVIDWDEARETEFAGVDWINFKIQEYRTAPGVPFSSALQRVSEELRSQQTGGEERGGFAQGVVVLALAWLRYVVRAAQYPGVLAEEAEEFIRGGEIVRGIFGQPSGRVAEN